MHRSYPNSRRLVPVAGSKSLTSEPVVMATVLPSGLNSRPTADPFTSSGVSRRLATGSTEEFMALAEKVSGEELDAFFDAWIFTPEKPPRSAVMT